MSPEVAWRALQMSPQAGLQLVSECPDDWCAWARGALLLATGDFAGAFDALRPLADSGGEVKGLAAAKVASGLRQLDEHLAAVPWDERACAAGGPGLVDGLVGLAADAVGRAVPSEAAAQLDQAADRAAGWRDRVRIDWVATEIALLTDGDAVRPATRAFERSVARDSPRHVVKSQLFLAAAWNGPDPDRAEQLARTGLLAAAELALVPFVWPFVAVLDDRATAADQALADDAVRFIAERLPPGHGAAWLRRVRAR